MQAHGATVIRIPAFVKIPHVTECVLAKLHSLSETRNLPLIVSAYRYRPEGMQGVESIAELAVSVPAPPATSSCRWVEVVCIGGSARIPSERAKVHAVQPAGCSTVVASSSTRGDDEIRPVLSTTRVSGLSVPFDIDAGRALQHLRSCGGHGFAIGDEIFAAQAMLLEQEGINTEPAGATALAGWIRAIDTGT